MTTLTESQAYRLISLKYALKLEMLGLKHSRGSAYATIKKEFGYKGSKQLVFDQFAQYLKTL